MQRQILAYLREKLGEALPHSPENTKTPPRTLGRGVLNNVRGANPPATPTNVRGTTHTPTPSNVQGQSKPQKLTLETVILSAIQRVKEQAPPALQPHTRALYEAWRGELLAGQKVLTARGGTRYLHRKIRQEMKTDITASGLDALLALFRAYAFKEKIIFQNPRYTGKPPYARFLLVGGE